MGDADWDLIMEASSHKFMPDRPCNPTVARFAGDRVAVMEAGGLGIEAALAVFNAHYRHETPGGVLWARPMLGWAKLLFARAPCR